MPDRVEDMLRKAMRLSAKNAELFEQGLAQDEEGPGGEVFEALRDVEFTVLASLESAERSRSEGEGLAEAEGPDPAEVEEVAGMFAGIAERFSGHEAEAGVQATADAAAEALQSAIEFYEQWLEEVEEPDEERFVEGVLAAERAMYALLSDLRTFFEDPESWAPESGDPLMEE